MKVETVLKILARYSKGLEKMEQECSNTDSKDAEHYKTDKIAMEQAIKIIERSST